MTVLFPQAPLKPIFLRIGLSDESHDRHRFILLRMPDSQEVTRIGDISDYRLSEQIILTLNRRIRLASENMDLINIKS